jgi:hypothetical protein
MVGEVARIRGLTDVPGVTLEAIARAMEHPGEIAGMRETYEKRRKAFGLAPDVARAWDDFVDQLNEATHTVQTEFVKTLKDAIPGMTKFSEELVKLVENVFIAHREDIRKWMTDVSHGLEEFAKKIASPEFQKDVNDFIDIAQKFAIWAGGWMKTLMPTAGAGQPLVSVRPGSIADKIGKAIDAATGGGGGMEVGDITGQPTAAALPGLAGIHREAMREAARVNMGTDLRHQLSTYGERFLGGSPSRYTVLNQTGQPLEVIIKGGPGYDPNTSALGASSR